MLKKRKPLFLVTVMMLVICMAFDTWTAPRSGQTVIRTLDGSIGQLKQDSVVLIEDAIFYDLSLSGKLIKPYKVQNLVSLEVNEDALLMVQSDFKATARLQIKKTDANNQITTSIVDLELDYKKDGASAHRRTHIFSNAYRVEVKVLSLNKGTATWDVFSVLKVVNQLQSFPEFNFHCTNSAVQSISITGATPPENTTQDELAVNWPGVIEADEYDLEWTYIDKAALDSGRYGNPANPDPKRIFANNASRVTITGTSYKIPLFYDKQGHLFFRVRSVHWSSALGAEGGRMEADWSSSFLPAGMGRFNFLGHEQGINWQSTTSFAEEGKRKSVVQYYDGSLRSRQTVTKDNVSNSTIATESFYDYQGRPVIQVMPVPTLKNVINYTRKLNRAPGNVEYDKSLYDTLPDPNQYCGIQAIPMDTSLTDAMSASRYYSPANDSVAVPKIQNRPVDPKFAFIPDAEQYPFSEVEYAQDNTGRIIRQSGVGKTFRMGGGRETQYAYGTPDQKELDALFGTEVGNASHYQKSIVRDANGQFSISYVDMRGRTIATALAGSKPSDIKLDTLAAAILEPRVRTLSDPSSTILRDLIMESRKSIEVTRDNAFHQFLYTLTPESVELEGNGTTFCYDCLYDLQITITSDCNNGKLPKGVAFDTLIRNFSLVNIDTTCTPAQGFNVSFSLLLNKGIYEVTKKLSVSQSSLDYYRDSLFMKRNRLRDLQSFIAEQRVLVNLGTGCKPECAGCLDSLGTWTDFWTKYKITNQVAEADASLYIEKAKTIYNDTRTSCIELCGLGTDSLSLRAAMKADVTPPYGQYANPDKDEEPYSVFNTTKTYWKSLNTYKDENGDPALVYWPAAGRKVAPQELSEKDFIDFFQDSWAETLLPLHPEFCLLEKHEMLNKSHEWDRRFESIETYEEARKKGYLNPTGATGSPFNAYAGIAPLDNDPLATLIGGYFKSSLETAIGSNYQGMNFSLYSMATISVVCNAGQDVACYNLYQAATSLASSATLCEADRNNIWNAFKIMYLQVKRDLIQTWARSLCPGTPSSQVLAANYVPHFAAPADLLNKKQFTAPSTPAAASEQKAAAELEIKKSYESNCKSYVEYWIKTLGASCANYDTADLRATVVPKLLKICTEGADLDHPFGSSSVAPASTNVYKSFEDVIREYNQLKNIKDNNCNAYPIEVPRPYDQQLPNSKKPIIGKPSDCECELINKYNNQYLKKLSLYKSFGEYMRNQYATVIEDSTASYLVTICNTTIARCDIRPGVITLPTAFQCGTGDICIDCDQFAKLDSTFRDSYPEVLPSADPALTDSTQRSWNKLYERFMNYKTGYTKTAFDYLEFASRCNLDYQSFGCDSLNRIYLNFAKQRREQYGVSYFMRTDKGDSEKYTNPYFIVRDGTLVFPDTVRQRTTTAGNHIATAIPNLKKFCASNGGFTVEVRARFLQSPQPGGYVMYLSAGDFFFTIAKYNSPTLNGLYLVRAQGYADNTYFGIEGPGNNNGFSRILVSTDSTIINRWFTLKAKITPSNYYIYFNDQLLVTLNRNASLPLPDLTSFSLNMLSRHGNIDWFKYYDANGTRKYFEDFNNMSGYTLPDDSAYCQPSTNYKPAFTTYFNQQNNSNLSYEQIMALYLSECGRAPDPFGSADMALKIVDSFNKHHEPARIIPVLEGAGLTAPNNFIDDPYQIIRDGILQYPAALQTNADPAQKPYYAIHSSPGTELCMSQGFSVETRTKFKQNPYGSLSGHLFTFELTGNATAKLVQGSPAAGVYLSEIKLRATDGSWVNYLSAPVKLMDSHTTFYSQWNDYKLSVDNDSARFYFNGIKVAAVANPRNALINSNGFSFSAGGYLAQFDWVRVKNKQENVVMFEDFNNPGKLARFDGSFLCATTAPCQTAFVNYYNQQRGSSYTYKQIDSLYFSVTGRSLDVCGAMDSLLLMKRKYNRDANPYKASVAHFLNAGPDAPSYGNQECSFDDGIFNWPDFVRDPGIWENWFRYSNIGAPGTSLFCGSNGFTLEARLRALKDNARALEENLVITIGGNFMLVLSKWTEPGNSKHGYSIARIVVRNNAGTDTIGYNILQNQQYKISTDPSFLSKQWHTVKVRFTLTSVFLYWNDTLVFQGNRPPGVLPRNFNAVQTGFMGTYGAIDWLKLYNGNDELMFHETYDDPIGRTLINPAFLCPQPTINCQTSFVNYYNSRKGTNYNYVKLDSLYKVMTGTGLNGNFCDLAQPKEMLCGRSVSAFPVIFEDELTSCSDSTFFIESKAQIFYENYLDSLRGTFDSVYKAKCLQAYKFEQFTVRDTASEYHYTLYYYDQAGNLVKTIPPAGVRPNRDPVWLENVKAARAAGQSLTPVHQLPTDYRYNALNQVVAQKSPDGGLSKFWYDRLGRLVISQNAKQKYASTTEDNRLYSYTKYDTLGRITEVGQVKNLVSNKAMHDTISRSPVSLSNWLTALNQRREQITSTVYDLAYPGFTAVLDNRQIIRQRNLRNRVSYTTYTDGWNIANFNQGSFYTYDIHGNVDTLLQDYGCGSCSAAEVFNLMNQNGNRFKKISYNYDLISGKVNSVAYQKGWSDQFFHRYSYDGENRLTLVETSLDGFNWDKDARYEYYLHGPLARTVLGSQQVQGLDYAYTLQGWLKGVNSAGATEAFDMSGDGRLTSGNRYVARDAFGFALNYYGNDYKAILNNESLNPFPGYSSYLDADFRSLYNGNISSMVSTNRLFEKPAGQTDTATLLFNYQYDQLNRITGMDAWSQFNRSSNSFAGISKLAHYREKVAYDPNGNILKYVRHGNGPQTLMDSLTYEYYAGTNKLRRVRDSVFDANRYGANAWDKIVDIDDQVDVENYVYDSIGNLIRDKAEKITNINWNVYGKITGISREAGTQVPASEIRYSYDAAGNRISKTVEKNNQKSITWYVRDAQGNVMATYTSESASSTPLQGFEIKESERYLYGSSRLGVVTTVQPVDNGNAGPAAVVDTGGIFLRGERIYELSNHLGNVLVTVSDRKKGIADPITSSLINHFEPVMLSGTDYYPFGMAMRVGGDSSYRFGFNGQEMSNEIKGGEGNSYTAEFWEYDPRIGRRWNVDPVTKENESPYAVMGNNPIWNVDIDGADTAKYLNNSQLLAAIKIAYNVVKSHVDNKTFNIGQDYSGEVNKAMFSYLDENPNISFGGVAELKQQAFDYYKGFKEVAASVNGGATLDEFGSKILNNKNVNTTSTILLTQKLINSKNGEFGTVAAKGAEAFTIIMGAADPVAGSGSKGTRINSNRAQQIVNAAPAKNALSTTFETSLFRPTHAINRSKTQMQALLNDIKVHGIREPIKYVEQNGIKYIVDGHHRYYAAQKLGIKIIPAEQVQLPYGGYRTTQDLIFEGQMPGFWKNLK